MPMRPLRVLIKCLTFLLKCELLEYDLLFFISGYHTDLLEEKFQPSIKTRQVTVQGIKHTLIMVSMLSLSLSATGCLINLYFFK